MLNPFSTVPVRSSDITGNFLQAQVRIHVKDLFTGFFYVEGSAGQTVLLFSQGNITGVYQLLDDIWVSCPKMEWDDMILASVGDLRVASVPVEGLRILRLFLESDLSKAKEFPLARAGDLPTLVKDWERGASAGLVVVLRDGTGALLLYPSGDTSVSDGLLLEETSTQAGAVVVNQVRAWGERPCQVLMCTYESKSEAWKEYDLRISFSHFVQTVLRRYEELAGRFLVTDLDEHVNEEIKNWGLSLSLYGDKLSNRQFFDTAERAGQTYINLFKMMDRQMEVVIGEKMVENICSEAVMQLGMDSRMLVQEYVLSRLDSEIS